MIRRSPAELYIKFLLCHPDGYDVDTTRAIIYKQQLDWVDDNYALGLKARMNIPVPFYPTNKAHKASSQFVYREKLAGFFTPDAAASVAHQLLQHARAKETIETGAIVKDPPAFIAHRLRSMSIYCTVQGVQRYLAYYYDLTLVDTLELNALQRLRIEGPSAFATGPNGEPTVHDRLQYQALSSSKYRDPRTAMLSIPISSAASLVNQIRQGMLPKQVDLSRIAEATRAVAAVRTLEAVASGGPLGGASARDYAMATKLMTELIQDLGSPTAELKKGLQQLALKNEDSRLPLLSDMSDGKYTTDLQPEQVVEEEEEVEDEPGT
jgi:hypothetical protein